jgi:glucose-6-phosphate isomerase
MPFDQSIESARAERIGPDGVTAAAFDDALARAGEALDWLRARHTDGTLPLLRLPAARDDLPPIRDAARRLSTGATDVVILGTGGSSLGGQTLAQLAGHGVAGLGLLRDGPRLHFMDNLDGDSYGALLAKLPLATTRFVAISKSGGTGETLMQTAARRGESCRARPRTPSLPRPARRQRRQARPARLLTSIATMLDHDPASAGAFSADQCGLPPAACSVSTSPRSAIAPPQRSPCSAGAPPRCRRRRRGAIGRSRQRVIILYADRRNGFTRWYVQLGREPGKDGKGATPMGALGPVDQHSQLQLYLAGPRDKLFTIVTVSVAGRGPRIADDLARLAGEPDFAGRTIGDLVAAQGRATVETLAKNGCPVRTIHIDTLDEASLGELLMHSCWRPSSPPGFS